MGSTARLTPVELTALMCVAEALSMTGFAAYYDTVNREIERQYLKIRWSVYALGFTSGTPVSRFPRRRSALERSANRS